MQTDVITYRHHDLEFEGYVAAPPADGEPRPVVLVVHAWGGHDEFVRAKAEALTRLGCIGFAIDLYGTGRRGSNPEENAALMQPFMDDRAMLRDRLGGAVHEAKHLAGADPTRLGVIGFCFGGLCAIDAARAGFSGVRAVVSFHGLLGAPAIGEQGSIGARVLALHGWDDPLATPDAVRAFATEMDGAGADWQLHAYGGTMHAFTNPAANAPGDGMLYSPRADCRSWGAMQAHLAESFEIT